MNMQLNIVRDPAQLTGALVGSFAGWAIARAIISNAMLYKPLAIDSRHFA